MQNYFIKNKAFSIVEFLIVIAIFGILSTIVYGYLYKVNNKSADTTIKSNLQFVRAEARNYIDQKGNYGTATIKSTTTIPPSSTQADCSTANTILANTKINSYILDAEQSADPSSSWVALCAVGKLTSETNATSWAVAVRLKENAGKNTNSADGYYYWCVSSTTNGAISNGISGGGATEQATCI